MTSLIDQLAELTGHRDRQHADALLLDTLRELLAPGSVALHRCMSDGEQRRWLSSTLHDSSAGQHANDAGGHGGFCSASFAPDPSAWNQCLHLQRPVASGKTPGATLLPLMVGAQGAGVVELCSEQPLPEYMQRTAEAVVRLYGNFLALLDYGERDALTGLFNRKTFTDCFMRATLQPPTERQTSQVYLAALDLDHFKQVNDTFGHLIGDEVLLLTARLMRSVLRQDDGLFRFGGEEFVVLLEAPDEGGAHAALERLRVQMAQHHFPQVGRVTVSIGFTALQPGDLPTGALDRADQALYLAKASGRNQVAGPSTMEMSSRAADTARPGAVELF